MWYIVIALMFFILGKLHSNKRHDDECKNCEGFQRDYYKRVE